MLSSQLNPPKHMFDDEDLLLDALQREYKTSKGKLDFDGAYTMPDYHEGPGSIEKTRPDSQEVCKALVKRIWELTKRRWT
jgi:hypothetical protein